MVLSKARLKTISHLNWCMQGNLHLVSSFKWQGEKGHQWSMSLDVYAKQNQFLVEIISVKNILQLILLRKFQPAFQQIAYNEYHFSTFAETFWMQQPSSSGDQRVKGPNSSGPTGQETLLSPGEVYKVSKKSVHKTVLYLDYTNPFVFNLANACYCWCISRYCCIKIQLNHFVTLL